MTFFPETLIFRNVLRFRAAETPPAQNKLNFTHSKVYVLASPRWSRWLASKTTARTRLPTRKADNDWVERNVSLFYPHIFIQSKTCLTSEDKGNCGLFSSLPYGWVQVSLLHACCQLWSHGVPGGNRSVPHDHSGATWAVAGNQRSCRTKKTLEALRYRCSADWGHLLICSAAQ